MTKPAAPRPLDLNAATVEELTRLPGVGRALARRIVAARPFKTVRDLILIDGGQGQVNASTATVHEMGLGIPVIGIAKGAERKRNDLICDPKHLDLCRLCEQYKSLLIQVRDEAHRFAITYHRKIRSRSMRGSL